MTDNEFQGYVKRALEDIGRDVKDIKAENKEQWQAIRQAGVWNKIAAAVATTALIVASWFGFGKQ